MAGLALMPPSERTDDGVMGHERRGGCGMVGIERLGLEDTAVNDAILVTTRDGALVDVGPVIRAGLVIQERLEANPPGVVAVLLGMRIAVGKVCGSEGAKAFEEWVNGDD